MPKVVLFARVSHHEGQTTESQLLSLRAVAVRLGWEVVKEVSVSMSAWNPDTAAEAREKALSAVRETGADILAVWAFDRVCRAGIVEAFNLLSVLEKHLGVAFYSLQEPFLSTATADPAMRSLLLSLFAWMAEQESRRKSERIKAHVKQRKAKCAAIGKRPKWGRYYLLTDAQRVEIHVLRRADFSVRDISMQLGISKSAIGRELRGVPQGEDGPAGTN